jgi:hypothetical protein
MLPSFWGSLTWPLFGVLFWWIAGRSIDALLAARRHNLMPVIRWFELLVALVEVAGCSLLCAGFITDPSFRAEFIYPWGPAFAASVFWIFLGATTFAAFFVQRRLRKRLRISSPASD